jgi:hypothetical protein
MTSITVTAVLGNGQRLDGGAMFGNAPRAVWEKWIRPDDLGRIPLSCRAMLVEIDGRLLLCETGIGAFFEPKMASRYGVYEERHVLLDSLKAIGVSEADIDFVILSHLHFDHAGGLLPSRQSQQSGLTDLMFPRAKYVVGSVAFDCTPNCVFDVNAQLFTSKPSRSVLPAIRKPMLFPEKALLSTVQSCQSVPTVWLFKTIP